MIKRKRKGGEVHWRLFVDEEEVLVGVWGWSAGQVQNGIL